MGKRVVITGIGVVAPNGVGVENFNNAGDVSGEETASVSLQSAGTLTVLS
jgi:hypothetical protein